MWVSIRDNESADKSTSGMLTTSTLAVTLMYSMTFDKHSCALLDRVLWLEFFKNAQNRCWVRVKFSVNI